MAGNNINENGEENSFEWNSLEHKGPYFPPPYERLPKHVKFFYDGCEMELSERAEEVAYLYAKMLYSGYAGKRIFDRNFFESWSEVMDDREREIITDLRKCNFKLMNEHFKRVQKERKSKQMKLEIKNQENDIKDKYGFCMIDGCKERVINFKIPPPSLFRGRGNNPRSGMLKKRIQPEDVIINCSKNSNPIAPQGHQWKDVIENRKVTWLAKWSDNTAKKIKYVQLHSSSEIKSESTREKFEKSRRLHDSIESIRDDYRSDWESDDEFSSQLAVALYFIDEFALRAGNDNDTDIFGCCSLQVRHIRLENETVILDFIGKCSVRFNKEVTVESAVFQKLQSFMKNKRNDDKVFHVLTTERVNNYLNTKMEGLTMKVFRTYSASVTFQDELATRTTSYHSEEEKILIYKQAVEEVAQRYNHTEMVSRLSYIDPRIIVAWCKKFNVPIERIFRPAEMDIFRWAIEEANDDFVF